jgi:uncharacterized membrane protein YqjE
VNPENSQRHSDRDRDRDRVAGSARDLGEVVTDSIGNIVDYLHLRGILVRLEASEAGAELGKKVALLAVAGLFFAIGYVALVTAAVAWAVASLEWSWPVAIAIAGGIHLTIAFLAFLISRRHPRQPLFRDTLRELEKDRQWLSKKDRPKN